MKILFQIDNYLNIQTDTSVYLMNEALSRGFEVYYFHNETLSYNNYYIGAEIYKCNNIDNNKLHSVLYCFDRIDNYDICFIRKDPPVDMNYQTSLFLLSLCQKVFFINNPEAVLLSPEKIFSYHNFSSLETIITMNKNIAIDFINKNKNVVLKPLYQCGGKDIIKINDKQKELSSIIESYIEKYQTPFLLQQFDDNVLKDGDMRILILDGTILGAFKRKNNDNFLSNTVLGAKAFKVNLSDDIINVANKIAIDLKDKGIYFAGLDFIGNNLIEINVTSPTGLVHYDILYEKKSCVLCWDRFISLYKIHIKDKKI